MDESECTLLTLARRSEGKPVATHSLEVGHRAGSSFGTFPLFLSPFGVHYLLMHTGKGLREINFGILTWHESTRSS